MLLGQLKVAFVLSNSKTINPRDKIMYMARWFLFVLIIKPIIKVHPRYFEDCLELHN